VRIVLDHSVVGWPRIADGSDTQQDPPTLKITSRPGESVGLPAPASPGPPFSRHAICDVFEDIDHQTSEQTTKMTRLGWCMP